MIRMPAEPKPARRVPNQARSQHTVAAIFEAARRLAAQGDEAQLTTNRIAELAGVSIGTLYQYFPTREAVVSAIVQRDRAEVMRELDALLSSMTGLEQASAHEVLRRFVGIYLRAFAPRDDGRRALVKLSWRYDHQEASLHSLREASERIAMHLQRLQHPDLREPTPAQLFVLTRALMGSVRAAVLEDSPLLDSSSFEDELVRLCWALLKRGD
jgi:AcrR family transcriptional regulator